MAMQMGYQQLGTSVRLIAERGRGVSKLAWAARAGEDLNRAGLYAGLAVGCLAERPGVKLDAVTVRVEGREVWITCTLRGGPGTRPAVKSWQVLDTFSPLQIVGPMRVWQLANLQLLTQIQLPWREEEV